MKAGHRRTLGGRVHLVGKSLLVIMGILLVQSVCSLFLPGEPGRREAWTRWYARRRRGSSGISWAPGLPG